MGNEVNLICSQVQPKPKLVCQTESNQTSQVNNQVFKLPNLESGDKVIFVAPDGSQTTCAAKQEAPADIQAQNNSNNPAFCSLTMPESLDMYNATADLPRFGMFNSQTSPISGTPQPKNNADSINISDIILQKAVQDYMAGKITSDDLIKIKTDMKDLVLKEAKENEVIENENKNAKLTTQQKDGINKFLNGKDNKTFTRDDFQKDEKISGAQTATQNIEELGIVRTVKVLSDGTRIEITENPSQEGHKMSAALKGQRGGLGTGLVGAFEAVGGALLSATGFGAVLGVPMMADGARRVYNSAKGSAACTAVITRPDGSQQTIKNNYREDLYKEIYKNLGIVK